MARRKYRELIAAASGQRVPARIAQQIGGYIAPMVQLPTPYQPPMYKPGPFEAGPVYSTPAAYSPAIVTDTRLARMESDIARLAQGQAIQGGPVYPGDYEAGVPMHPDPFDVSKGGILQSQVGTLIAAAPAGTQVTVEMPQEALSRLTNTMWAFCAVALQDELADPDEASKCTVTADITGSRVNTLYNTPLDVLSPNLMGDIYGMPVQRIVGADAVVKLTVDVVTALTTAAASTFVFRLYSGSEVFWGQKVR